MKRIVHATVAVEAERSPLEHEKMAIFGSEDGTA